MYPVSEAFQNAINKNTRTYYWSGVLTTEKHTYNFTDQDVVKGSGYINRQCCGSSEIELGSVYSSEMGITLYSEVDRYTLDNAEIKLYFHLVLEDGVEETIPMGIYEVTEANRHIKTLELTAYDYMLRFDKDLSLTSASGTAYDFLEIISVECEVELAQTREEIEQFHNGTELLGIYSEHDMESYRDLLYYTAQVLGCISQINREGKLELLPYGTTPAAEISRELRFDSNYSDFVTRYTAVSSTNLITETAEYYALEVDDALTLNLESNPLLQFGIDETRERILNNILNAISVINYTPFDSSVIGNPALDPMDVLIFSGGHADETQISLITSITYKIGGKQSLKCVGKNPKLAAAKSKVDKSLTGLLNQVEADKTVYYNFTNLTPFEIREQETEVITIDFTSKEETTAIFLMELLYEVQNDETEETTKRTISYMETVATSQQEEEEEAKEQEELEEIEVEKEIWYPETIIKDSLLTVIYKMNKKEISVFRPQKTCRNGKDILTLFLPVTEVAENSSNTLSVHLMLEDGTLFIGEYQIKATISGQGLVSGLGNWNGEIDITEFMELIPIDDTPISYLDMKDTMTVGFEDVEQIGLTQEISVIEIATIELGGMIYD